MLGRWTRLGRVAAAPLQPHAKPGPQDQPPLPPQRKAITPTLRESIRTPCAAPRGPAPMAPGTTVLNKPPHAVTGDCLSRFWPKLNKIELRRDGGTCRDQVERRQVHAPRIRSRLIGAITSKSRLSRPDPPSRFSASPRTYQI